MHDAYAYDAISADAASLCAEAVRSGQSADTILARLGDDEAARFVAERALTGGHIAVNPSSAAALRRALDILGVAAAR